MTVSAFYDIVVVGAGPAGSMAAYAAARAGVSVLLLEKDREIGIPVRCAEAVGKEGIEKILDEDVDPRWIAATIRKFKFVAPDDTVVYPQVNGTGYVLHRKLFDFDLAMRAANAGAHIITKACVTGLKKSLNGVSGVHCLIDNEPKEISAKIVIAADGVESRVARWAGLKTTIRLRDMETCSQVTLANLNNENDTCIFYFSQEKFPGGYGWLFPKGNGCANVGLGIAGNKARYQSAAKRLEQFLKSNFPNAPVLYKTIGGVPCTDSLDEISMEGLLVAGDAALQSNPLTGGGITTGMVGGKLAGHIASEAILKNDVSSRYLKKYDQEWAQIGGNAQKRFYRIKEGIKKLTDQQLNDTARNLADLPPEKHTLARIFQNALIKQPSLIVDIVKILNPFSN